MFGVMRAKSAYSQRCIPCTPISWIIAVVGLVSERLGGLPVELDASVDRTVKVAVALHGETELKIARFRVDLPEAGRRKQNLPSG